MDLDQGLRELQGPEARFREVQRGSEDGIRDDCSREKEGDGDHGNRQGEEFSVHIDIPAEVSKGGLTIVIVPFDLLRWLIIRGGVMMQGLGVKSGTARGHHLVPG